MAYIKGRSTQSALSFLCNDWVKSMDKGLVTCACLIDLAKCFDCVHHNILIDELNKYGFRYSELRWFHSYLQNRKQIVKFDNEVSPQLNLNIGVPQGTVLGPILYLIYMNDLPDILPDNSFIMYADDITLYSCAKNLTDASYQLQALIDKTAIWIESKGLVINTSKSNCMVMRTKRNSENNQINVNINGNKLNQISETELLGIHIDENLTWKTQCTAISRKLSKKFGLMKRLRSILPLNIISKLYSPLIQSHIDCCITVWGNCDKTSLSLIQKLQNRIARFLTCRYDYIRHPSSDLRKELHWMSVSERYNYFMSILMYKCVNFPDLYKPLSNCYNLAKEKHNYSTRNSVNNALSLPYVRTEKYKKCVAYAGANIWNNIPTRIRDSENILIFKRQIKQSIININ